MYGRAARSAAEAEVAIAIRPAPASKDLFMIFPLRFRSLKFASRIRFPAKSRDGNAT